MPGVDQRRYAVFVDLVGELSYWGKETLKRTWIPAEKALDGEKHCDGYEYGLDPTGHNDMETRLQFPLAIIAFCFKGSGCCYYTWGPEKVQMHWNERDFVKVMIRLDGNFLRCTTFLKDDKEIAQIELENVADLDSFGQNILKNCQSMTRPLYIKPKMLSKAPQEVRNNPEMVIAAIRSYPKALQYASDELRIDKTVVSLAVSLEPKALKLTPSVLKNNLAIVSTAIISDPTTLKFASPGLKNDRTIVSTAVSLDPMTLRFASKHMRSDRELVLQAVRLNGVCLKGPDDRLLRDPALIKAAFRTYPGIIGDVKGCVYLGWDFDLELVKSGAKLPRHTD